MIKAVFFDFYNTLVRFWPLVEEVQALACREIGVDVEKEAIRHGYREADDFFNQENSRDPLFQRTEEERDLFFARYEQLILRGAGVEVTPSLAHRIWEITTLIPKSFEPFDDVSSTLSAWKNKGLILGVLSNLDRDMGALVEDLGCGVYLDFCITSKEVGAGKPHPPIFRAALERSGVAPHEAVHVGDQLHSDVEGAKRMGITPVLLDREGWHPSLNGLLRVRSLSEVALVVGL